MASKKQNKSNLYLSDKPPLTLSGKIGLGVTYAILIIWALLIIIPLATMVISSFNGLQDRYIVMGSDYKFSFKQFRILFTETYFVRWVINTLVIACLTAIITLIIVSYTGYVYSRFRFKGKKRFPYGNNVDTSYTSFCWNSCILYNAFNS